MNKKKFIIYLGLILTLLLTLTPAQTTRAQQQSLTPVAFLPLVTAYFDPLAGQRVVNVPYLNISDIVNNDMEEMAVFWFGQISPNNNYTDVRIAYSNANLEIHTATIDQYLWYNEQSTGADLENYDTVAITLQTDGAASGAPTQNSWRIVSELRHWQDQTNYTRLYQGNGSAWVQKPLTITTAPVWRGDGLNGTALGRGWWDDIRIPFSSLGLSSAPANGALWRIGVRVYDRDNASGAMQPETFWPTNNQINAPSTWSLMHFGLPSYTPPTVSNQQTVQIYQGNNGAQVPDAEVGGGTTCSDGLDFYSQTGNANYAGAKQVNVQNQEEVADWPCFSKYYVTFPLNAVPAGKVIHSAKLVMHQFGGSGGPGEPVYSSFLQVSTIADDWDEKTITWNNAPLPLQNLVSTRVNVFKPNPIDWNNLAAYQWDVTQSATQASLAGNPLKLVLYTPASAQHSGKYFISSDDGWDTWNLPTLVIEYGDR